MLSGLIHSRVGCKFVPPRKSLAAAITFRRHRRAVRERIGTTRDNLPILIIQNPISRSTSASRIASVSRLITRPNRLLRRRLMAQNVSRSSG